MIVSEIKILLDNFSTKHGLVEKAIDSCNKVIDYLIEEDQKSNVASFGGFSKDEIILEFDHQKLLFSDYYEQSPLIVVQIGLYIKDLKGIYLRNLESIGYYQLHINGDAEIIDDVFVIEKEKNEIDLKSYYLEFNSCLPKNGLNSTSMHFNYVNYINRFLSFCQSKHYDLAIETAKLAYEYSNNNDNLLKNEYYRKTRKGLKRIISFLFDDGLIKSETIDSLITLGILKSKNVG